MSPRRLPSSHPFCGVAVLFGGNSVPVDEFSEASVLTGLFLNPKYPLSNLSDIFEQSNMLPQCVAAYVTNIAMYGWEIVQASPDTPIDAKEQDNCNPLLTAPMQKSL